MMLITASNTVLMFTSLFSTDLCEFLSWWLRSLSAWIKWNLFPERANRRRGLWQASSFLLLILLIEWSNAEMGNSHLPTTKHMFISTQKGRSYTKSTACKLHYQWLGSFLPPWVGYPAGQNTQGHMLDNCSSCAVNVHRLICVLLKIWISLIRYSTPVCCRHSRALYIVW